MVLVVAELHEHLEEGAPRHTVNVQVPSRQLPGCDGGGEVHDNVGVCVARRNLEGEHTVGMQPQQLQEGLHL